jgi:nitrile hydratase accessory protein
MASEADPRARSEAAAGIGPLAREDGAPVFGEPWQAQVLAIAASLAEHGLFSASDWAEALGAELRRADSQGAPDTRETYYAAALAALEGLLAARGIDRRAVAETTEAWRRAYLATPHGLPVELKAGR